MRNTVILSCLSLSLWIIPSASYAEDSAIPLEIFEREVHRAAISVGIECEIVEVFLSGFRGENADRLVPVPEWRFAVLDSLYQQKVSYAAARGFLNQLPAGPIDTGFLARVRNVDLSERPAQKKDTGVQAPRPIERPLLPFTDAAREARVQGLIRIRCVVLEDGTVANCRLERGLGYGMDEAAILNVQDRWRFEPATRDGKPIAVEANIEIEMSLTSGSDHDKFKHYYQ